MVGVWTAQRVSDYNNIGRDDIQTLTIRSIVDEPDPENAGKTIAKIVTREVTVINIRQKKTGAKVAIPCSSDLKRILEKYNFQMPHLEDQVINRYIKDIGKAAGLTEIVNIVKTNGGEEKEVPTEKYKLIHTHTARRTGATLMYLSGMDVYDIIKITGHTSPVMLRKYIKGDELEVVEKITEKYKYFDLDSELSRKWGLFLLYGPYLGRVCLCQTEGKSRKIRTENCIFLLTYNQ